MLEGGACHHTTDFTDHPGGKNHLRFPEHVWEDEVHHNMDNYTNRISCSQMIEWFKMVGFKDVKLIKWSTFDEFPIKRKDLDKEYEHISDEDLKVAFVTMIMKK